jgi:hypothetical protein
MVGGIGVGSSVSRKRRRVGLDGKQETSRIQKAYHSSSQADQHRERKATEQAQAQAVEGIQGSGLMGSDSDLLEQAEKIAVLLAETRRSLDILGEILDEKNDIEDLKRKYGKG